MRPSARDIVPHPSLHQSLGDMAVADRTHFAIAKVQASEHVVFIEVKLSSVGSDYAAVAPCFRKIEREVELDQFTARGLQLFNGDVTAIRERERWCHAALKT